MIYTKTELLNIWSSMYKLTDVREELTKLTYTDYLIDSAAHYHCPKCRKDKYYLIRVAEVWACFECHGVRKYSQSKGIGRTILIHRICNDMNQYFGHEITTEMLFDDKLVEAFKKVTRLEDNIAAYMVFCALIRKILSQETKAINILRFLGRADTYIRKHNAKYERTTATPAKKFESKSEPRTEPRTEPAGSNQLAA